MQAKPSNASQAKHIGWEFQFLVQISETPNGSEILIPFLISETPVVFILKLQFLESQKIGVLI
jgi:hypothetical protein